jgi:hypothetical protein
LGHTTAHFNVGQYRRTQKGEADVQDAAFFDHNNPVSLLLIALHDVMNLGVIELGCFGRV